MQTSPPPTVVFLAYNIFGIGGTVRATINTANGLVRRGWDVSIISVRRTSSRPHLNLDTRVRVTSLVDVRRGFLGRDRHPIVRQFVRRAARLPSALIRSDEDLYGGFSALSDLLLVKELRRLRSCILVTTIPSFNLLGPRLIHPTVICVGQEHKEPRAHPIGIQRMIEREYGALDALTCVTPSAADYYQATFAGSELPVHYMPNCTDVVPRPAARAERGVVLSAGRLVPEKGFGHLIDAFARVAPEYRGWKLRIFGDGPLREDLKKRVVELGVHNQVFIHRSTHDLPGEMADADVFALCSASESFGMVLVEAMAHGLPCVAFESEGPRHLIDDGSTGFLVPQLDAEMFGTRLATLMADSTLRDGMGHRARGSVVQYSTEAVVERWEELLGELTRRRQLSS